MSTAIELTNKQVRLAARPVGLVQHSDFSFSEEPVREPADGEVLVDISYISLDPAMRGWMTDLPSYIPPVGIGEVMRALAAGRVIASKHPGVTEGDRVTGLLGAQRYATVSGDALNKVDTHLAPLPVHLGTLGMPGMTAYFGLLDIGRPQEGETVVVSGAAGAVGSVVGQIAKLQEARAVGIAGGPQKCRYITDELGFDAAIDYKAGPLLPALREHCPEGIDVYFDNVGGDVLDAALALLARDARVVICGAISQYNAIDAMRGPSNYLSLLVNHASMTGFVVPHYAHRLAEAARALAGWFAEGKLTAKVDVAEGLENFPEALLRLFKGENTGKLVLKIAEE